MRLCGGCVPPPIQEMTLAVAWAVLYNGVHAVALSEVNRCGGTGTLCRAYAMRYCVPCMVGYVRCARRHGEAVRAWWS